MPKKSTNVDIPHRQFTAATTTRRICPRRSWHTFSMHLPTFVLKPVKCKCPWPLQTAHEFPDPELQVLDRLLVRCREALPDRLVERCRWQCLRMRQAAFPAQEAEPQAEGFAFYRWLDLLGEFRAAREHRGGSHYICWIRDTPGSGSGIRWYVSSARYCVQCWFLTLS